MDGLLLFTLIIPSRAEGIVACNVFAIVWGD